MRRLRLFAVFACLAAADCGDDPAYVHVYVQGSGAASGNALTSQPFTLDVVAFGDGQRADLSYPTHLRPPDGPTTSPFTDFLLDVSARPQDPFDLRFVTKGVADNVPWGGDAHLASPVAGQSIVVTLTRGEDRPFKDELFSLLDGDMQNATLVGGAGLALAWVDRNGVRAVSINPDRPVGRGNILCADCGAPKSLRIASRPLSPFGSDLYAVAWADASHIKLQTEPRSSSDTPLIDMASATGADIGTIGLACFRKGAKADVVALRLEGQDVVASLHDENGTAIGDTKVGVTGAKERTLVGVVTSLDDAYTVGVRGATSRLVRIGLDGTMLGAAQLDGDLRALGLSADGNRLLVATSQARSSNVAELDLSAYSATDLVRVGDPQPITQRAFPSGTTLSPISISSCGLAWAEKRDDGSEDVDVRVQRIDDDGNANGAPSFANVAPTGTWFAPTIACASQTRVFITMFDHATEQTGNLYLRRLP